MSGNNIPYYRKRAGLSQSDLAGRIGTTLNMLGKLERGGRKLDTNWLEKIGKALDVEPHLLIDATVPMHMAPDQMPVQNASEGETTPIVALDLSLSMGPGTPIEDFVESEPVEFDIGLLRNITRSPYHRLRIVRGIGNSMEPKFYTGDRILVDTTDRSLSRIDGYYWITLYGAHGLKRLRPAPDGKVEVISENKEDFDPMLVDLQDLTIEGRAIWVGREL
jgi:phage repressor protein C with HTH and peptisase S24 domain